MDTTLRDGAIGRPLRLALLVALAAVFALAAGAASAQEAEVYPPDDTVVLPGEVIDSGTGTPAETGTPAAEERVEVLSDEAVVTEVTEVLSDGLAATGSDIGPLLGLGALLLVVGAALVVVTRRRRERDHVAIP